MIFLRGSELEYSLELNVNPFIPNAPFLYPLKLSEVINVF